MCIRDSLCTERLGKVMDAGMHGSTCGGNPVVCAGALAVLRKITAPGFLEQVAEKGAYLREKLTAMEGIAEVRGIGMMLGATLKADNAKAVSYTHLLHGDCGGHRHCNGTPLPLFGGDYSVVFLGI